MTDSSHPLAPLQALPGVQEGIDTAREACTALRWHEALRRRIPEAAAESRVRGAAASAMLEGAEPAGSEGSVDLVRDLMRGAVSWDERPQDPVWRVVAGAVRATAATEQMGAVALRSPAQVLAALHTAAASELLPAGQLGRPRRPGEEFENRLGQDLVVTHLEMLDADPRVLVVGTRDELRIRRVPSESLSRDPASR